MESRDPDLGDVNDGFFFLFSGAMKPLWGGYVFCGKMMHAMLPSKRHCRVGRIIVPRIMN